MPHHNSVFHTMLKLVPWNAFEAAVARHGGVGATRGFSFASQLAAMLYAQFSGAASLREIETGLHSQAHRLYHLGVRAPRRSSLADANRHRPAAVFSDLLGVMIQRVHRGLRRQFDGVTHLIDSTSLMLNERSAAWSRFSAAACGVKLHVVYDPDADCPIYAAVSPANVNDITAAKAMPVTAGATYVFDLGYYDYAWWAKLDAAGCRIVTRLKRNTPLAVSETRPVEPDSAEPDSAEPDSAEPDSIIQSDRIGTLPPRQAKNRRNPLSKPVREVLVCTGTGKPLRLLTNDLTAPAREIADLYKRRWAIELFFRWIKQVLKITRFLGTSENAVRIQIAVALIAFLLLRLAHKTQTAITSPLAFARLVKVNLMHRRPITQLLTPYTSLSPPDPRQGLLI